MRTMLRRATLIAIILLGLAAQPALAQKRLALLIGNQDYATRVGKLKNPSNDVRLIAGALQKVGFEKDAIHVVRNADRVALLDAVDRYVERLVAAGDDAIGFFYYSGHGAANKRDRRNYIIPVGVEGLDRRVWFKAIALDDIVSKLSQLASNAAHFVVFDACRNLLNTSTRGGKGFVPVETRRGMLIAFSTDPGETASDEGASSGPYAAALASELTKPGLDHLDLFQNVKETVYRTTRAQVPWTRDGMLQRIYLSGRKKVERPAPKPVQPSFLLQAEAAFWSSVKGSKDPAIVQSYLQEYPNGKFAQAARALVSALTKLEEQKTLALLKESELRHAKEEEKRASEARTLEGIKALQAKQEQELRAARANAERLREELLAAEKTKSDAVAAVERARVEQENAERTTKLKLAALPNPSNTETAAPDAVDDVKAVQAALKRLGCYFGPIDGLWGLGSKSALRRALGAAAAQDAPSQDLLKRLQATKRGVCKSSSKTTVKRSSTRKTAKSTKSTSSRRTAKGCRSYAQVCGSSSSQHCKKLYREYVAGGC